jgi:hypothetical protein
LSNLALCPNAVGQDCKYLEKDPKTSRPVLFPFDPPQPKPYEDGVIDLSSSQNAGDIFASLINQIRDEQARAANDCVFDCAKMNANNYFRDDNSAPGILRGTDLWTLYEFHIHLDTFRTFTEDNKLGFRVNGMASGVLGIDLGNPHFELVSCRNLGLSMTVRLNPTIDQDWNVEPHAEVKVGLGGCDFDIGSIVKTGGIGIEVAKQAMTTLLEDQIDKHLENVIRKKIDDDARSAYRGIFVKQLTQVWTTFQKPTVIALPLLKNSYILLEPKTIQSNQSPVTFASGRINLNTQIGIRPVVFMNEIPADVSTDLPNLSHKPNSQRVEVPIEVRLDFDTASSLFESNILLKQPLKPLGLSILGADVSSAGKDFLVKLKVNGKMRALIFMSGNMRIGDGKIQTSCLRFQVQSRDPATVNDAKALEDLLNESHIIRLVEDKLVLDLTSEIQDAKTSIFKSLKSPTQDSSVSFRGKTEDQLVLSMVDVYAVKNEGFRLLLVLKDN